MKSENNPNEKLGTEHSDPFRSPTEFIGSDISIRRLFIVSFNCPLCGEEHTCELYMTLQAQNEEEMMEKVIQTLNRDDVKVRSLAPFAKTHHQQEGDYLERAQAYVKREARHPFQVTSITMTNEDSYTCNLCRKKFETIGAWRQHDGRNPNTGIKLDTVKGLALCQTVS